MEKITTPNHSEQLNLQGFTLVEILIAIAMSSVVILAIHTTYTTQQKVNTAQAAVVEMQQNIRAGMTIMTSEVRMAGYDPQKTGQYGITAATANSFSFTADTNDDGGPPGAGESYQYELYDSDGDGLNDALRRTPGGSALANGIYNLNFVYQLSDGTRTSTPAILTNIRSVQISILARAIVQDLSYQDSNNYPVSADLNGDGAITAADKWGPFNDRYRRRFFSQEITCRNMGL